MQAGLLVFVPRGNGLPDFGLFGLTLAQVHLQGIADDRRKRAVLGFGQCFSPVLEDWLQTKRGGGCAHDFLLNVQQRKTLYNMKLRLARIAGNARRA